MNPAALKALIDGNLENLMVAATPSGIEAQEAEGQKEFVANQTLPKDCPTKDLEKLGFVFGKGEDDIFISVQFPEGWEKNPTDHSMWSDLIDDKGRKRGGIFYKAAFYDRSSHMYLSPRFSIRSNYELENESQYLVLDGEKVIYETEKVKSKRYSDKYFNFQSAQEKEAKKWLDKNYPAWQQKSAYWD